MLRTVCWTAGLLALVPMTDVRSAENAPERKTEADGREIFERVWEAGDPRSHGGDGLGPVFNASSCVACHDQGGAGGGGAFDKNVKLLTVTLPVIPKQRDLTTADPPSNDGEARLIAANTAEAEKQFEELVAQLKQNRENARERAKTLHPEFAKTDTVVLHAKGTNASAHQTWQALTARSTQQFRLRGAFQSFEAVPQQQAILQAEIGFNVFPQTGPAVARVGLSGQSFPVLSELMRKAATLKGQSNQGTTLAVPFSHGASLRTSQRNTTALWGAGLIDAIPDEAIEEIAARQAEAGGRISGRPHRFEDGRIGRFGWKGQKASLYDFTIAACANELGLEVPGAHQATVAYDPEHEPKGFDLNEAEVDALVDYLGELPAPVSRPGVEESFETGRELFASIGCASCHVEQVGEVVGLYSDLLLHDLGTDLGAVGSYGVPTTPEPDPQDVPVAGADGKAKPAGPTSREWRTAPLWGVASSAPYLHDGRAKTLAQAVAFHGGEAAESRLRYLMLDETERAAVDAFLGSLVAPEFAARD